jgi:hypothetical protein
MPLSLPTLADELEHVGGDDPDLGGAFVDPSRGNESVVEVGVEGDPEVRRQRPGRGRPDDGVNALGRQSNTKLGGERAHCVLGEAKLDVDRRALVMLVVLDLGLGQRGAAGDAPVHRLLGLVDEPLFDTGRELAHDVGLVRRSHGQVRRIPLAQDAETHELLALDAHELLGPVPASLAEGYRAQVLLPGPQAPVDLQLDGKAVAVPTREVGRVETRHATASDHDVLEDLVEGGAQVDVAVGVGWTVVQDEERPSLPGRPHLIVEVLPPPGLEPLGLRLWQVGLHREVRLRKIERGLEVERGRHKSSE